MSKYGDYLRTLGATDEEVKILDSPVAARAYDKQIEDAQAALEKQEAVMKNYEQRVNQWYQENDSKLKQVQNKAIAAEAEAARAKAALLEAERQGLLENVAKNMGYEPAAPTAKQPDQVDDRYLTMDKFNAAGETFVANLTGLLDAANEHARLFPGQPFNAEQLRREAQAAGKTLLPYWEEKYKVRDAREAAAQKQREAEIAKWKAEGATEKERELVSKFGNPETRPMMPSKSPFAPRPADPIRAKQPWDHPDGALSNDRVARAAKNLIDKQLSN
jgi:hypothetical protein